MTSSGHNFFDDTEYMLIAISSAAIAGYTGASILQSQQFFQGPSWSSSGLRVLALATVLLHAIALHQLIDINGGQNLSLVNLLSQCAWMMALIALLLEWSARRNLTLFIFPLCAVSLIAALLFPATHLINTKENLPQLIHIVLAVITFSVVGITGLQASLIHLQHRALKNRWRIGFSLPSLEAMEQFLFRVIAVGWALLTTLIVSSLLCFPPSLLLASLPKILLTSAAWCVFSTLLIGRNFYHWSGHVVVRWSIIGFALLLLLNLILHG